MSYDAIINNISENIAVISSGFKDLSARTIMSPADSKPTLPTGSTTPVTPSTPSNASDASGSSSSVLVFTRLPLPQLDRGNYPNVQHWCGNSYKGLRKLGKNNDDDDDDEANLEGKRLKGSILSCYMEDENGEQIPEATRYTARGEAKAFFNLLMERGRAPPIWGDVSIDAKNELIHILESRFPFLRLCDDHWKANKIATNSYSQWYPRALKRRAKNMAEKAAKKVASTQVIDVDADDNDKDESLKRPRAEDDDTRHSKRPRAEGTPTTPPPRPRPTRITTQRQRVCKSFYFGYMRH
jgi:hypothetical protein